MMISGAKPMKSWGDLNLVLNRLVREGAIEGFRTNRELTQADPEIVLTISADMKKEKAVDAVLGVLTGVFAEAALTVEVVGQAG